MAVYCSNVAQWIAWIVLIFDCFIQALTNGREERQAMDVRVRLLVVLLGLGTMGSLGCTDAPAGGGVTQVTSALTPAAPAMAMRWSGSDCEIEIVSPDGFPPRGLDPVLYVGGTAFRKYRYSPTVGVYGVIYRIAGGELASLPEGAPVVVAYGPNPARGRQFGLFYRNVIK
jgi:hypothetical protein